MTAPKNTDYQTTGENVSYALEGDTLVIRIDTSHRNDVGNPKTIRVATTSGNKEVGNGVVVGVNAYVYRNPK